jgi:hypothetical protein
MIKKLVLATFAVLTLVIMPAVAVTVSAADPNDPLGKACSSTLDAGTSSACQSTDENPLTGPSGVITTATQVIAMVVGVAAVIMIIIGGFKYMVSSGDPKNIESAKNTILFAIIGLVIALVAQAIVLFVLRRV